MFLSVLAATVAEHNSSTSQSSHLTVRREKREEMASVPQSYPSAYVCKDSGLLFPWKYFSKLSTQHV